MRAQEHEIMRSVEDHYWWYRALRRHVVDSIRADVRSGEILDAGCGTGGMLQAVRDRFPDAQLTGIDAGERAVQLTRERGLGAELVHGNVQQLPFRDSAFDCVLSIDVWTAATVDAARAARETHRVLRPGGQFIVNVAAFKFLEGEHDTAVDVNRRFTRAELHQLLDSSGFTIERSTYWNVLMFPAVAAVRWWTRAKRSEHPTSDFRPVPWWLNGALRQIALQELNLSRYLPLPFGTSLFAVATKK
jgi:SAM-dependent methyltransferase